MSTPAVMAGLLADLQSRFNEARSRLAACSMAPNSYGAGYEQGYYDALGELIESISGDPAVAVCSHEEKSHG